MEEVAADDEPGGEDRDGGDAEEELSDREERNGWFSAVGLVFGVGVGVVDGFIRVFFGDDFDDKAEEHAYGVHHEDQEPQVHVFHSFSRG